MFHLSAAPHIALAIDVLNERKTKMKKFKTGDKIVRVGNPKRTALVGFTTIVTETYHYIDAEGDKIRIIECLWELVTPVSEPVKSDGGSSSYYNLVINGVDLQTEDIMRDVFGNDYDFCVAFKALVRAYGTLQGGGKEGNTVEYEMNKLRYSSKQIEKQL